MESPAPVSTYPTPVIGQTPNGGALIFPGDGSGLAFDDRYPITFPPVTVGDLASLFPTVIPRVEHAIYERVNDACSSRSIFPTDGSGIPVPFTFNIPPDVSLFKGMDGSYTIPVGKQAGQPVPPIKVVRGWPAFPGDIPAIGVAESTMSEDESEDAIQGGFAGDVFAKDSLGNVVATCAYYAQPVVSTVVVELIHTNRDERDRLDDQLRRVILPLRRLLGSWSTQIRDVTVDSEKQDLPLDEQPNVIYVSVFTVTVRAEALIPTEITPVGVIEQITTTVTPTEIPPPNAPPVQT